MGRSTTRYTPLEDGRAHTLLSILTAFVHRIRVLRSPTSNDRRTLSVILRRHPDELIAVRDFTDTLKWAYNHAVYDNSFNPDHARVCQLDFIKELKGLQREYILAYVTVDGQPWSRGADVRLGVLVCEHKADLEDDPRARHYYRMDLGMHVANHVILYDPSDLASVWKPKHKCLYRHHFCVPDPVPKAVLDPTGISVFEYQAPETCPARDRTDTSPPSLYDLAAAAIAINRGTPEHTAIRSRSFWFAAMLYYALGGEHAADDRLRRCVPRSAAVVLHQTMQDRRAIAQDRCAIAQKLRTIAELDRANTELDRAIAEQDRANAELDRAIAESERAIAEKDRTIAQLTAALAAVKSRSAATGQPGPSSVPQVQSSSQPVV
ncbi:hypothetical protein FKP32DRAFT_1587149 [Trametes sanguinea]|nr:hypothetical protein FKP32DRAFT_1587149 [Trametes sanguinea]